MPAPEFSFIRIPNVGPRYAVWRSLGPLSSEGSHEGPEAGDPECWFLRYVGSHKNCVSTAPSLIPTISRSKPV